MPAMDTQTEEPHDNDGGAAPAWIEWRERVASPDDLAACVEALGLLPLRAEAPWPALWQLLAPGTTTTTAWAWVGTLIARRQIFAGRVLPGLESVCLTSLPVFALAFARGPGSDPLAGYSAGQFGITGKAVVELLLARGPLTMQQIRLGLGQHKRFLIHDTPQVMAELERALTVIAGGPELAAAWRPGAGAARAPARARSRFNPPPSKDLDLRVWELTMRWAPPAALAAADRLREHPPQAREGLRARLLALNPGATGAELDALLGEDPHP
jgi:hypothetical protein